MEPSRWEDRVWPFTPLEDALPGRTISLSLGWWECGNPLMSSRVRWDEFVEWMRDHQPHTPSTAATAVSGGDRLTE